MVAINLLLEAILNIASFGLLLGSVYCARIIVIFPVVEIRYFYTVIGLWFALEVRDSIAAAAGIGKAGLVVQFVLLLPFWVPVAFAVMGLYRENQRKYVQSNTVELCRFDLMTLTANLKDTSGSRVGVKKMGKNDTEQRKESRYVLVVILFVISFLLIVPFLPLGLSAIEETLFQQSRVEDLCRDIGIHDELSWLYEHTVFRFMR